jgi:dynein heavy chain
MAALMAEFDAAKAKEQKLTDQFEDSERKCKRAVSLIEKLGKEEENWKVSLIKSRADKLNVVGDVVISSGIIAYLGIFT